MPTDQPISSSPTKPLATIPPSTSPTSRPTSSVPTQQPTFSDATLWKDVEIYNMAIRTAVDMRNASIKSVSSPSVSIGLYDGVNIYDTNACSLFDEYLLGSLY